MEVDFVPMDSKTDAEQTVRVDSITNSAQLACSEAHMALHALDSSSSTPLDVPLHLASSSPRPWVPALPATLLAPTATASATRGWFTRSLDYLFEGQMKQADKIEVIYCNRSGCEKLFTKYFAAVLLVVITVLAPILLISGAFTISNSTQNQTSSTEGFCDGSGQNTVLVQGNVADCFTSAAVNYPMTILFILYSFIHLFREKPFIAWRANLLPKIQAVRNPATCLYLAKALIVVIEICLVRPFSGVYPIYLVTDIFSATLSRICFLLVITCDFIKGRKHRSFLRVYAVLYVYTRVQRVLYGINVGTLDGVLIAQLVFNIIQAVLVTPITFLTDLELQQSNKYVTPTSLLVRSIRNAGVWGIGGLISRIVLSIGEGALTVVGVSLLSLFIANAPSRSSASAVMADIIPISAVWLGVLICHQVGAVVGGCITPMIGNHFKPALFESFKKHAEYDDGWLKNVSIDANILQSKPSNASSPGAAAEPPGTAPAPASNTSNYVFQRMWMINSTFKHSAIYVDFIVNSACTVFAPCAQAIAATIYLVHISSGFSTIILGGLVLFSIFTKFRVRACREHSQKVVMMNDIEPYGAGVDLYPAAFDNLGPTNCDDYRKYLHYVQKQTIALNCRVAVFDFIEYFYLLLALSTWIIFGNVYMIQGGFATVDFTSYVLLSKQLYDAFGAIIVIVLKLPMVNPSYENMAMGMTDGWFRYPIPYKRKRAGSSVGTVHNYQTMEEMYSYKPHPRSPCRNTYEFQHLLP